MKKIVLLLISINMFAAVKSQSWSLLGNAGTNPSIHFLGTTDNSDLLFRVRNKHAGIIDSAYHSTFFGYGAGKNFTSYANTGFGFNALTKNTGTYNTAVGSEAMKENTTGTDNTAVGTNALSINTTGSFNTATGGISLANNTTGIRNTALGYQSGYYNYGGSGNTAIGTLALMRTAESQFNTGVGYNAGSYYFLGWNNVFVGANTRTSGPDFYNCIAIGQDVVCTNVSQARIGNSATSSIGGYANWTNISDSRFKKDITSNVPGLDFIMQLNPVTYHLDVSGLTKKLEEGKGQEENKYNRMAIAEKEKVVYTGFLAQEVEAAAKKINYDFSGVEKPENDKSLYGLRYSEFVVPLVKAIQEQQQQIAEMEKEIELLKEQNKILRGVANNK